MHQPAGGGLAQEVSLNSLDVFSHSVVTSLRQEIYKVIKTTNSWNVTHKPFHMWHRDSYNYHWLVFCYPGPIYDEHLAICQFYGPQTRLNLQLVGLLFLGTHLWQFYLLKDSRPLKCYQQKQIWWQWSFGYSKPVLQVPICSIVLLVDFYRYLKAPKKV